MRTAGMVAALNEILTENDVGFQIISVCGTGAALDNGLMLSRSQFINLKQRCKSNHAKSFLKNLYSSDNNIRSETERNYKSFVASLGGKALMQSPEGLKTIERAKNNCSAARAAGAGFKKGEISWNKGLTKDDHESIRRISESHLGSGNPMFGKVPSIQQRERQSIALKARIKDGSFTPKTENRFRKSGPIIFDNQQYRSSWELVFHISNPDLSYETLRIHYNFKGKQHVYIVDFVDYIRKVAYEVKPRSIMQRRARDKAKYLALKKWSIINGFSCFTVDDPIIASYCDQETLMLISDIIPSNSLRGLQKLNETYITSDY